MFRATYQSDSEDFLFGFVQDTSNAELCPIRWAGEITPKVWDDRGPVQFTVTMAAVLECDNRDLVIEWEGEGVRS